MKICPLCGQDYRHLHTHIADNCTGVTRGESYYGKWYRCPCGKKRLQAGDFLHLVHYGDHETVEEHVLGGLADG